MRVKNMSTCERKGELEGKVGKSMTHGSPTGGGHNVISVTIFTFPPLSPREWVVGCTIDQYISMSEMEDITDTEIERTITTR